MEWTTDNREWYRTVYLSSEHWKNLRRRKLAAQPSCEMCGRYGAHHSYLDVHHVNYRNIFDVELTDLLTVCRRCHKQIHLMVRPERRKKGCEEPTSEKGSITVIARASAVMFGNKCVICEVDLDDEFTRLTLPMRMDGRKWRFGIPVCSGCSEYDLTDQDCDRVWKLIDLMLPSAASEAFKVAQSQIKHDLEEIVWGEQQDRQTQYIERRFGISR
jgi:hypothetical protein